MWFGAIGLAVELARLESEVRLASAEDMISLRYRCSLLANQMIAPAKSLSQLIKRQAAESSEEPAAVTADLMKSQEVEGLMRLHGFSFADACELVVLDARRYSPGGFQKLSHIPSPRCIAKAMDDIRSGRVVISISRDVGPEFERQSRAMRKR